ncbi:hypothetical protein CR513_12517, partial [Mucuna pruriens]
MEDTPILIYLAISNETRTDTNLLRQQGSLGGLDPLAKDGEDNPYAHNKSEKVVTILLKSQDFNQNRASNQIGLEEIKPSKKNGRVVYQITQVLADFIIELSSTREDKKESNEWTLSMVGVSNQMGREARIILEGLDGVMIEQSLYIANRNEVGQGVGAKVLTTKSDSQLVIGQGKAWEKAAYFAKLTLMQVPWEQNSWADLLSKLASTKRPRNNRLLSHHRERKDLLYGPHFIMDGSVLGLLAKGYTTNRPFRSKGVKNGGHQVCCRTQRLYKQGFSYPLLKCLSSLEIEYIMKEALKASVELILKDKPSPTK